MALTVWNIRGLNQPTKLLEARNLLVSLNYEIFRLLETKVRKVEEKDIIAGLGEDYCCITNYSPLTPELLDSIWVGYRKDIWKGIVLVSHSQYIRLQMSNECGLNFVLTVIYASNKMEDRKQVWEGLVEISNTSTNLSWIALGDFNEVTCPKERISQGTYSHDGPFEFIHATMASQLTMSSHQLGEILLGSTTLLGSSSGRVNCIWLTLGLNTLGGILVTMPTWFSFSSTEKGCKHFWLYDSWLCNIATLSL